MKEEKDEIEQNQEIEEFEEILRLTLQVKSENLLAQYKINPTVYMNGLRKFSCESCIYTAKNVFYISSPHYRKEINSTYWDLGYLDIKNLIFYETNILSLNAMDRTLHFSEWTNFLQVLIDKKLLANLFEVFNFNKGVLSHKDRILHELGFFKSLRNVIDGKEFSSEFAVFLCDMMKNENNYVSYTIMKKKISSNLKNFMDNLKLSISS